MSRRRGSAGGVLLVALLLLHLGLVSPDAAVAASTIETFYAAPGPSAVSTVTVTDGAGRQFQIFHPTDLGAGGMTHPVITWGNGTAASPANYPGLLNHLASWRFVVVAFTGDTTKTGVEMLAGATYMVTANATPTSPFYQRIDTAQIASMGHSQGAGGAINAANLSDGLITSVVPIALTRPLLIDPAGQFDLSELTAPIFFLGGNLDLLISPPAVLVNYYNLVPGAAARAVLKGAGHLTIQNTGGRFLGYITAWMMWQLEDDGFARGAFVGSPPEIVTNTAWQNQAVKNLT